MPSKAKTFSAESGPNNLFQCFCANRGEMQKRFFVGWSTNGPRWLLCWTNGKKIDEKTNPTMTASIRRNIRLWQLRDKSVCLSGSIDTNRSIEAIEE